jgi:NarL family two-component system response regulator LiaR
VHPLIKRHLASIEDNHMDSKISVLIVDDHEVVRNGVRAFLESQTDFVVVGETGTGEEAVNLARELRPEVVLMDLVMQGMQGVEATRKVKKVSPDTQVVVLTSYHQDDHVFPALRAGAISYILKDTKMDELADACRRAAKGEATLHPRVAARVIQEIKGNKLEEANPLRELTSREMEILGLIAEGLSNAAIAEKLVISENTVKGHVSNILGKLHLSDRTQAAVFAWKEGIVHR